jgi:hypothetical protein
MGTIFNANVSSDSYSGHITPSKNKTIDLTYRSNHGSGTEDLVATLKLQVCDDKDPANLAPGDIGFVDEPTHSFNSHPAGSDAKDNANFANCNGRKYRVMIDMTGGTDGQVQIVHNEEE